MDGTLQIDFSNVKVDLRDYSVELDGESDLSRAIEILFSSFKSFFRQELTSMLAWRLAKSVEESINQILISNGGSVPLLEEDEGYLNMSLVSDPIYVADYLSFPLDGSFSRKVSTNGKSSSGATDYPKMPVFVRS